MHVHIPNGGFFLARNPSDNARDLVARLEQSGARAVHHEASDSIFAAFKETSGQGLWQGEGAVVAHDLDLTNELDLRRALGFSSGADIPAGQLLWLLYRRDGTDFVNSLRGQFGFALWDGTEDRLQVATDFYGIRPVVYSRLGGDLYAGTRIRHLLHAASIPREIDPEAIYQYLFFEAICSPSTIYRHIKKLGPGYFLLQKNGDVYVRQYYDIRYAPETGRSEQSWEHGIFDNVRQAVSNFVPLSNPQNTGCYLSGGTDSSSVAGFYTKLSGTPAKTFSIGFSEEQYNELDYAHLASECFGTEQHDAFVTPENVLELLEKLPLVYDEPFGNSSVVPAFFCAKAARDSGMEALLGGDGGDEIFGGNERYVNNLVFEVYHKLPAFFRHTVLEPLVRAIPERGLPYRIQRYIRRANIPNPERFYSYRLFSEADLEGIFQPEFLSAIDPDCFMNLARSHYERAAPAETTDRLLYLDMKFTVTDNDLRKVTQMAEATKIRVRYPLLDRDLVDFTATIPPSLKVKWKKNRYIFKRAMQGFLPQEIIEKKKHGMGLPVAPWFKSDQELANLLHDTLLITNPIITRYVKPEFLQGMKRAFIEDSTTYYGSYFWKLLVLELWFRQNETAPECG